MDLSDDESLRASAEELLHIVTGDTVKVMDAANRHLSLAGNLEGPEELRRMLEAIQADIGFAESVDCSQVSLPVATAASLPAVPVASSPSMAPPPVALPTLPKLPVVGVLMTPYPCLVMRDGSRVVEGAEFHGFTVDKISEDAVLLRHDDITLKWKP